MLCPSSAIPFRKTPRAGFFFCGLFLLLQFFTLESDERRVADALEGRLGERSQKTFCFFAKCLPSWPPSPEIRTAHAKFTDFHVFVFRISA